MTGPDIAVYEMGKSYRAHCWHFSRHTGFWSGSRPVFVCCRCGGEHIETPVLDPDLKNHGRHAPPNYILPRPPHLGCIADATAAVLPHAT